ncbi:MAG: restriction endonuclease subunit S [Anaerolineales bacterium]
MDAVNLPKLRFPEFYGKWEYQKLADIASVITEKAGNGKYTLMSITSGVGLVSQIEKFGREIAGQAYKNYIVIRENDFAYNKSSTKDAPEGFLAMYSGKEAGAVPNSIFTCFSVQKDKVIPKYLSYLFLGNLHGRWLRNFITVGARAHGSLNVDDEDLMSLPVPLPQKETLAEQQKIADCLTSLDELISAQSQKVQALQAYKKGLMQNLFPPEGETVPRLRFPEFESAGEWEVKKLKNVSPAVFDGTHQTPTYTTEGIPFYSVENIVSGAKNKFISPEDYAIATNKNKPEKSDILLTRIGKIGFSQVVTWDFDFSVYVTLAVIKSSKSFVSHFLHYYMQSNRYQNELFSKSLLNAVPPKINMDSLRDTEVLLPKRKEEQQRIADFLSSIDEEISAHSEAVELLKSHKKGLMQGLFPSVEEVQK